MSDDFHSEDPTPVIPPRQYLVDRLRSLGRALGGAVDACNEAANVVESDGRDQQALDELENALGALASIADGAKRAVRRIRGVESSETIPMRKNGDE